MAEELNLEDKDNVESVPISRFKEVSKKQIEETKAREASDEARKKAELDRDAATKEASFYKDFSGLSGKYQGATDHADEIKAKVLAGYTVEDATVSVLNKAGKLTPTERTTDISAGGSASNPPPRQTPKSMSELNREELRKTIIENDGDIMDFLRTGR
jgi:hypothetical protein